MTIQEITELRKQERDGELRMPNLALELEGNVDELRDVNLAVEYLVKEDKRSFLLLVKMLIKGFDGVKALSGVGVKNCPYEIETDFGSGSFYNANEFFEDGKLPKELVRRQCFNNCYLMVTKKYISNCEILSGIAYIGANTKPFLHSVIKQNGKILDFNYNLCMDEDLYYKLFNFEVLSNISSKRLIRFYPIIKKHQKFLHDKGFSTMYATFACKDLINYVMDKNRRENEKVEIANI